MMLDRSSAKSDARKHLHIPLELDRTCSDDSIGHPSHLRLSCHFTSGIPFNLSNVNVKTESRWTMPSPILSRNQSSSHEYFVARRQSGVKIREAGRESVPDNREVRASANEPPDRSLSFQPSLARSSNLLRVNPLDTYQGFERGLSVSYTELGRNDSDLIIGG
ncbi:hypothetical protein SCHPADRAFT_538232 [Schizopora paradoxa]|uniref:Uncharacterized protein n=1 Tax=Schizopora paradoxa TaxID=27342 RepID=A0A0H2RE06_9AGAM|nr:hypothetical protein SCHPADRAFT_538232 [Schizopora paradoxa]